MAFARTIRRRHDYVIRSALGRSADRSAPARYGGSPHAGIGSRSASPAQPGESCRLLLAKVIDRELFMMRAHLRDPSRTGSAEEIVGIRSDDGSCPAVCRQTGGIILSSEF